LKITDVFSCRSSLSFSVPFSCSTIKCRANSSDFCAVSSVSMSRYRSVPVSASTSPGLPCAWLPRLCAQAAIESAERRACSAIIATSRCVAGVFSQCFTMRTLKCPDKNNCQRRAVCQLPLLESARAGLTMTTDGLIKTTATSLDRGELGGEPPKVVHCDPEEVYTIQPAIHRENPHALSPRKPCNPMDQRR